MTKPNNQENENQNTLMSWTTGKLAMYAIGIAAGIFIWRSGLLQKATGKFFSKKKSNKNEEEKSNEY